MSITTHLVCCDCREEVWIGQRNFIYTGEPETMKKLEKFLYEHMNHNLCFTTDEGAYDMIKEDE
jgi:hypothetical protein